MAKPDHTAPARLSDPLGDKPSIPCGRSRALSGADREARKRRSIKLTGIAIAVDAVACVLARSDALEGAQANAMSMDAAHDPLTLECRGGLLVAVHFLNQYAKKVKQGKVAGD
ncbi:hypothetical protein SAMN05216570_0039 [Dyella sp. OK004]|uniref:hypothetical protein n=1 Tax=Dyella sp. OK004 TaxID=1855292 RepID=UPI0008E1227A|nr:hypothetical protein [Dyella sp. OK004]SFR85639.1 hypothetical protein SAMN05216570_0039 [Dyella sp. OK004]